MTARVSSPVFIGRVAELDQLDRGLLRAASGTSSIILVGGEAGIGKSRLVAEAVADAAGARLIILRGSCVDLGGDDGLPFAPIAEALRELVRRLDPESLAALMDPATLDLARLMPALGAADGSAGLRATAPGELAQTRLFEAFLTLVGRVGSTAPVALVLEDLHWADAATRDLTAFLARNARDERLCVDRHVPDRRAPPAASAPGMARRDAAAGVGRSRPARAVRRDRIDCPDRGHPRRRG